MEKNGKAPSRNQTKHINIHYLFITDRVKNSEVSVVWYPTGDMLGDYMTKPAARVCTATVPPARVRTVTVPDAQVQSSCGATLAW